MEKKKANNIYLCVTEYHVLLSILISSERYNSGMYNNVIILCNGGRFKNRNIYNFKASDNIEFRCLEEDDFVSFEFVEQISVECTNSLFLFNLNYPHFTYLTYLLRKKNVNTSLVQDGLALYMYQPYTLRKCLSNKRWSFHFLRNIGIDNFSFFCMCYGWHGRFGSIFQKYNVLAQSSLITNIWLTEPAQAQYAKEKVCMIPKFSETSISMAHKFFMYESDKWESFHKNDILFVDQRIDGTSDFIRVLSNKFPTSTIYVKLHPRSPETWAYDFKELPNVKMIENMKGIPLELLIQMLYGVVVVSAYSSALLMDNPNCKFYYSYPWYAQRGYGKGEFEEKNIFNPTKHIKVIASVEEIVLY